MALKTKWFWIQFENLDGKLLAHTEFPIIINRIELLSVPQWVKQTSGWWSEGIISDEEFIASIEYLVREEIISASADKSEIKSTSVPTMGITIIRLCNWVEFGAFYAYHMSC